MYVILLILLNHTFNIVYCSLTLDYYQDLIERNQERAINFELPQSNAEFQNGYESTEIIDFGSYDFIIVGAGAAGAVLATRLSEIDSLTILLLEAGGEEDDFTNIPGMDSFTRFTEMNWGYFSTPQRNCCLGMRDQRCIAPSGKAIGGTTSMNGLAYVRGNSYDYDKWAELGNPGWSYEEVLPYFIKSENSQVDGDPGYHGYGGLWNVEYSSPNSYWYPYFIDGSAEMNVHFTDLNGASQLGISKVPFNTKNGRRLSTGSAFLDYAKKRQNLKVITKALATEIILNKDTQAAEGVIFITKDRKFKATATKETIVSGGAYNSPQLLMLSGIGPKEHLEEIGIEVIKDLPVGKTLFEHSMFLGFTVRTNISLEVNFTKRVEEYLQGYGRFTRSYTEVVGFIHVGDDVPETVPMLEFKFEPPGSPPAKLGPRLLNLNEEIDNKFLSKKNASTDIELSLMLLHPKSIGTVSLKSNSPLDFPVIDLNILTEPEDVDNFLLGFDFVFKLMETRAFKQIDASLLDIPLCTEHEKLSRDYWICILRQMTTGFNHPTSTTPMGPDPATSVVNSELKVHGIEKLRVVDSGVIPVATSGHTCAPTIMIAEKTADAIKKSLSIF